MDYSWIGNLVKHMGIQKGEIVLLQYWGEEEDTKIMNHFAGKLAEVGAFTYSIQHTVDYYASVYAELNPDIACCPERFFNIFDAADVVIDLLAVSPGSVGRKISENKIPIFRDYMKKLFDRLREKEKMIQLRLPSDEMAQALNINPDSFKRLLLNAYSVDYDNLKIICEQKCNQLKNYNEIKIISDNADILSFSIKDRKWFIDAGNGDFPSGEIYIAPIEGSAEGKLSIEKTYFDGMLLENLELNFQKGKLISSNNDEFNEILKSLPENAEVLAEFGIGLNDKIDELSGNTVLDEKGYGTIHIAIGMNADFGGNNNVYFHEDFVFKADVYFDNQLLIKKGVLY